MKMTPWTEKYRPRDISNVCGNKEIYNDILKLRETSGCVLIHGPPGTGKTTTIRSILNDVDDESIFIFDMSMKSSETSKNMTRILNNFIKKQTIRRHKIIVVDEIDCMRVLDQKVFKRLLSMSLYDSSTYSISVLFLCNNIDKVSEYIVKNCEIINFNLLEFKEVQKYLVNICKTENIPVKDNCLKYIFHKCYCDLRKTITTLQYLYMMTDEISIDKYNEITIRIDIDDNIIINLFKKNLKDAVDSIYYSGVSVIDFINKIHVYHKSKSKMTHEYVKVLAEASNDVRKTNDTWFIICFVISNSPIYTALHLI